MAGSRVVGAVVCAVLAFSGTACGQGRGPGTVASAPARPADPAGIDRIRTRLPADYEIAPLPTPPMPVTFWGIAPGWSADPAQCAGVPAVEPNATTRGWSASGPGGIVYALVATGTAPSAETRAACKAWTLGGGRTTAAVMLGDGPPAAGSPSITLTADVTTRVENGTETHSHASTLLAYTDGLAVSITVVTDPGAGATGLAEQLPAHLLDAAVQAIRSTPGGTR